MIDPVLVYSTYLGGSGNDQGNGIAVDSAGNAYITGYTSSTNFPTLSGVQTSRAGGIRCVRRETQPGGSGRGIADLFDLSRRQLERSG